MSTVGISLAGCVLALAVACRARTFGLRLTACFALSVLIGLPVWLLPIEWCTSQALLEEFSYLSSMLWAVICLLHVYLVVNTGLRVAWRFEVFCHAVGWGVPLLGGPFCYESASRVSRWHPPFDLLYMHHECEPTAYSTRARIQPQLILSPS